MAGLLLGFSSCTYYVYPPKVDTRTRIYYSYTVDKDYKRSKWRTSRTKTGYERYDKKGSVVEIGEYGEIWYFGRYEKTSDSTTSVTYGHGRNYKNINTVLFCVYDSIGKKMQDELWQFKDNKKNYLIYKTIFEYDSNGVLVKETEYDKNNKVSRLQSYSMDNSNQTISKDSVFNSSYEGFARVSGKRQDTTITDSLGRPIEEIHYYEGIFLYRKEFLYGYWGEIVTELRYDKKPDSLWCITEWQYNFDKQLIRHFSKVIGSTSETKNIYIYNRKMLLVKILHYDGEELKGYTKYKYKLY